MANGDVEPMSFVEQYIGRRWSITVFLMILLIVMVKMGATDIAQTIVGFLGIIIGYFFKDIADAHKGS